MAHAFLEICVADAKPGKEEEAKEYAKLICDTVEDRILRDISWRRGHAKEKAKNAFNQMLGKIGVSEVRSAGNRSMQRGLMTAFAFKVDLHKLYHDKHVFKYGTDVSKVPPPLR